MLVASLVQEALSKRRKTLLGSHPCRHPPRPHTDTHQQPRVVATDILHDRLHHVVPVFRAFAVLSRRRERRDVPQRLADDEGVHTLGVQVVAHGQQDPQHLCAPGVGGGGGLAAVWPLWARGLSGGDFAMQQWHWSLAGVTRRSKGTSSLALQGVGGGAPKQPVGVWGSTTGAHCHVFRVTCSLVEVGSGGVSVCGRGGGGGIKAGQAVWGGGGGAVGESGMSRAQSVSRQPPPRCPASCAVIPSLRNALLRIFLPKMVCPAQWPVQWKITLKRGC